MNLTKSNPSGLSASVSCPSCFNTCNLSEAPACNECGYQFPASELASYNQQPACNIGDVSSGPVKLAVTVTLGFTIDGTGSSKAFEIGIPKTVIRICEKVQAKAKNVFVSVQQHGDDEYGEMPVMLVEGKQDISLVTKAISAITYAGGFDRDETHLNAILNLMNTVPFPSSEKVGRGAIIALTTADSKLPKDKSIDDIAKEIVEKNLLLYLVSEAEPNMMKLAEKVKDYGGFSYFMAITNNPSEKELGIIADKIAASIIQTMSGAASGTLQQV